MNNELLTNKYKPIIGLEIHVELKTHTKMFCKCSANYFGKEPNTHTCPVCLGLPGALPYPNRKAIDWCVMIALALNCKINKFSYFERKNYFYPDLPKGYQNSQYKDPFGYEGYLEINNTNTTNKPIENKKRIRIRRVHMEEDTGKIVHTEVNGEKISLLDFNRSSVPLVEIVTEPDIENGEQAKTFLTELQKIIRYLGVSDADMEKGDMRLEPNISILSLRGVNTMNDEAISEGSPRFARDDKDLLPNYKVEVKNINSFRFVEKAINFEIDRQTKILEEGKTPVQETRGWNEAKNQTVSQRIKEEAHDYRYFPEPDLPPIKLDDKDIEEIKEKIVELPAERTERFIKEYALSFYDAEILTREKEMADYFEKAVKDGKEFNITPKQIANNIINRKVDITTILPAELIQTIVASTTKTQIDEKELEKVIEKVLSENQKAVQDFKNGKEQVIMFLVGQVMRNFKEKIEPNLVKNAIIRKIK